jgi:hypothetical protein
MKLAIDSRHCYFCRMSRAEFASIPKSGNDWAAAVVGSGIMGERLAVGNDTVALVANLLCLSRADMRWTEAIP